MRELILLCALCVLCGEFAQAQPTKQTAKSTTYADSVQPILKQYCFQCHGPKRQRGELRLDTLSPNFTSSEIQGKWIEVMDRINLGEMPPKDSPRPKVAQLQRVTRWIASELRKAEKKSLGAGGRVLLRRLNRTEYTNTLRDLLAMQFLPSESPLELLPPDGKAEGFDRVATALTLDPSLLEKYYEVAVRVADKAIVTGPPEFPTLRKRFEYENTARSRAISYQCDQPTMICRENDVVVMQGGARSYAQLMYGKTRKMIPTKGRYAIRVRASADQGERGEPLKMRITRGDVLIGEMKVEASPKVYEVIVPLKAPGGNELNVALVNGTQFYTVQRPGLDLDQAVRKAGKERDFAEVMRLRARMRLEVANKGRVLPEVVDRSKLPKLILDWVEVEGPLYGPWPPRSHELLLFQGRKAKKDLAYVRQIFERFLPRAYRRPVRKGEVDVFVRLVKSELDNRSSFEEAMRVGLSAVLTSPKFLYIVEPSGDERRTLNDHEFASRLSYFLWSSMPDEKLFALAKAKKLHEPGVLESQVDRMLADPKSQALVTGFGAQWLRTGEFLRFQPDERIYRNYDDKLGKAMVRQTLLFFEEVLRRDASVLSFIDSDWTMLDERLAKFYGIDDVKGEQFRKVTLPKDSVRGGLLGQGGVALWGSDGTRTKPVSRGVYVREVLFNDPPDPPPPNVGEIEPHIKGKNLTVRERLLQHQKIATCAACHRNIDPYGLALENFNAIGEWRERQDGEGFRSRKAPPIVVQGELPNGKAFGSYVEFRKLLLDQKDRFARALAEKMFVYALGRPIEPTDRSTIDSVVTRLARENYTFKSLIKGIVTSKQFATK
ncbi:MAG: DUF1592 domain-containing protein [Gemmataceae bacterium]